MMLAISHHIKGEDERHGGSGDNFRGGGGGGAADATGAAMLDASIGFTDELKPSCKRATVERCMGYRYSFKSAAPAGEAAHRAAADYDDLYHPQSEGVSIFRGGGAATATGAAMLDAAIGFTEVQERVKRLRSEEYGCQVAGQSRSGHGQSHHPHTEDEEERMVNEVIAASLKEVKSRTSAAHSNAISLLSLSSDEDDN
jgi:hypothetical protein